MTKAAEKYKTFKDQYDIARKAMIEQSRTAFKEIAQELFDAHPSLDSFSFKAYTDYFNDGETCYFHVYLLWIALADWGLLINGEDPEESEDSGDEETLAAVSIFLQVFDEEIIREVFGDHIQVTVYRDGRAEVEDYTDHD